jgi:hypothetical protein
MASSFPLAGEAMRPCSRTPATDIDASHARNVPDFGFLGVRIGIGSTGMSPPSRKWFNVDDVWPDPASRMVRYAWLDW